MTARGARVLAALLAAGLVATTSRAAAQDAPDDWPDPHGPMRYGTLLVDQLELAAGDGDDAWRWDLEARYGGETQGVLLTSEGERSARSRAEGDVELELLYARILTPFWNLRAGIRQDILFREGPDAERTFAVLGLEGLAPLWIELEPTLYVSDDGDTSVRLEATHELWITQRVVAQSRLELDAALRNATRFGVRSGLSELELGLRIRYELRRELAPYIGIEWNRKLGNSKSLARAQGDEVDDFSVLVGLRFWF